MQKVTLSKNRPKTYTQKKPRKTYHDIQLYYCTCAVFNGAESIPLGFSYITVCDHFVTKCLSLSHFVTKSFVPSDLFATKAHTKRQEKQWSVIGWQSVSDQLATILVAWMISEQHLNLVATNMVARGWPTGRQSIADRSPTNRQLVTATTKRPPLFGGNKMAAVACKHSVTGV